MPTNMKLPVEGNFHIFFTVTQLRTVFTPSLLFIFIWNFVTSCPNILSDQSKHNSTICPIVFYFVLFYLRNPDRVEFCVSLASEFRLRLEAAEQQLQAPVFLCLSFSQINWRMFWCCSLQILSSSVRSVGDHQTSSGLCRDVGLGSCQCSGWYEACLKSHVHTYCLQTTLFCR